MVSLEAEPSRSVRHRAARGDEEFDHRPRKLALRREMEARTWRKNETFCDYYIEKLMLANQINVDAEELVDLLIDGIPDTRLRDQARMNCYENAEELLRAFKKIG